jgi:hypothetical protein
MFQFFIQILFILYHIIDHFLLISKLTTHYSVLFFTYLYISLTNKPVIPFEILWGIPASLIYNVTQYSQKFDNLDIPLINTIRDRVLLSPSPGVRLRSWTCRDSISPFLGIFPNKKSCKIFLIFTVRLSYSTEVLLSQKETRKKIRLNGVRVTENGMPQKKCHVHKPNPGWVSLTISGGQFPNPAFTPLSSTISFPKPHKISEYISTPPIYTSHQSYRHSTCKITPCFSLSPSPGRDSSATAAQQKQSSRTQKAANT